VAPEVHCQLIVLTDEPEAIVREVVRFGELFNGKAKIPQWRSRTALFVEKVESDRPSRLIATMLPTEFVYSAFETSIQTGRNFEDTVSILQSIDWLSDADRDKITEGNARKVSSRMKVGASALGN
jgi:hypothetical protein